MAMALKRFFLFSRMFLLSYGELVFLLAVGMGVRAYRLGTQSVWMDEFFSAAYVDRPSLIACLRDQRPENWEMVPVYYSIQYYWAQWIGQDPYCLRWLSILFAVLSIALLYKMGRDLFGRWGGFTAGMCLALSPAQIFHGQGIRPYSLVVLLAIVSMYALITFEHTGRWRWCWINVFANVLLLWTHLFAALLLFPQAVYLLLFHGRDRRILAAWGGVHALAFVPVLLWVRTIRVVPDPQGTRPSFRELYNLLFCQESEMIRWTIGYPDKTQEVVLPPFTRFLIDRLGVCESLLALLLVITFAGTVIWLLWSGMRPGKAKADLPQAPVPPWRRVAFVFCWYLLPVLALFVVACFWKHRSFQTRYVLLSFPALYLLAGFMASRIRRPMPRGLFVAALLTAWSFQTALALALPMRTDFLGAGALLKAHVSTEDVVVVPDYNVLRILAFNMRPATLPLVRNEYPVELWDFINTTLASKKTVWFVLSSGPEQSAIGGRLESLLGQRGIPFDKTAFLGMQNLYVYRCPGNRAAI